MNAGDAAFLYQYGMGMVVFFLGMYLGYRNGAWSFAPGRRRDMLALLGMLAFYAALQGFFQFAAPRL